MNMNLSDDTEVGIDFLTVKDICKMLGVKNKCTVYRWVNSGFIPHIRIGRRVYFNKTEIDRFLHKDGDDK